MNELSGWNEYGYWVNIISYEQYRCVWKYGSYVKIMLNK
jgi:hypothetical protein